MGAREIRVEAEPVACAACGRRLLQGERPEIYLVGGARRTVCELCTVRANRQGWIRESAGLQLGAGAATPERSRFWPRRRGARRSQRPPAAPAAQPAVVLGGANGDDGAREPRHVHAVPTSGELKTAQAVEVFNASAHTRTVAGISRSLGTPTVTLHMHAQRPSVVEIAIAWELSWYRYEVDLARATSDSVQKVAQGGERSELAPEEQGANATMDARGIVSLLEPAA